MPNALMKRLMVCLLVLLHSIIESDEIKALVIFNEVKYNNNLISLP